MRTSETILEIREEDKFPKVVKKLIIRKFFKYFTKNKKKVNRAVFLPQTSHKILRDHR